MSAETPGMESEVTYEKVIELFRQSDQPVLTAMEVAEEFGITQQSAHYRLSKLHEMDKVNRRDVGAKAVVWWLADD